MNVLKKYFYLSLYYGFARYLPPSNYPINFFGRKLRLICARKLFKYCGENVNIEKGVYFGNGSNIVIGDNSGIGINCHVPNDVVIGNNVLMGPNVFILERKTHKYDRIDIPIINQGMELIEKSTVIGDDVWIGRQVLILGGKSIASHSIIGAGAVVSKNIPAYSVAVGNPIQIIKDRSK